MFNKLIIFLTLLNFCCLPLFAEELVSTMVDEQLEEDEHVATEDFDKKDEAKNSFETIEDLEKFGSFKRWNDQVYRDSELHTPREYDSKPYKALLPANTTVRSVKDDKMYQTDRKLFVIASAHNPYDSYADLINKDGSVKYITMISNLQKIEKDLDLYPSPKKYETYNPQVTTRGNDKVIKFENFFSLSFDSMDGEYISTFLPEDVESIHSQSLHVASYLDWKLPFQFGIGLSFHNISEHVKESKMQSEYLFVGPAIKVELFDFDRFKIFTNLLVQNTVLFELQYGNTIYELKSSSFKIDLGVLIPVGKDHVVTTLGYRKMSPKISNSEKPNNIITDPTNSTIEIISFAVGYNFNFIL